MGGGHCKPPDHDNETLKEIQRRLKEQEKLVREAEERQRRAEEERLQRQEQDRQARKEEEARRVREEEERQRREEEEAERRREEEARVQALMHRLEKEAIEARRREEQFRQDMADQRRRTDEEMATFQRQLEEQANERRRREEEATEARRREEEQWRQAEELRAAYQRQLEQQAIEAKRREIEAIEARRRDEQSRREAEEQQRQADEERAALEQKIHEAKRKLSKGVQPVVWPTREEVEAAKERIQYHAERLHFAICGASGSGKSSLINAFRGLWTDDPDAAAVGNNETTLGMTRYPDPRQELPYPRFVWCDVPGAGTFNIPAWQYFNQQGLFIFDFIILVYDNRFTQIDADILENCRRFNIPAFIVRSKASQQICNLKQDKRCTYEQARDMYVRSTRKNLQSNLQQSGLWKLGDGEPPRCYIVSRECVYDYIHSTEEERREKRTKIKIPKEDKKGGWLTAEYIDEVQLIHDLLQTAYERRYISKPERGRSPGMITTITSAVSKIGINVPINRS